MNAAISSVLRIGKVCSLLRLIVVSMIAWLLLALNTCATSLYRPATLRSTSKEKTCRFTRNGLSSHTLMITRAHDGALSRDVSTSRSTIWEESRM